MADKRFKSAKLEGLQPSSQRHSSIQPYRTIGLVSGLVPIAVTTLGRSPIITTVVGRSFQIFDASNLHLLFVSQPQTDSPIDCIEAHHQHVFAAWANSLGVYKRGKLQSSVTMETSAPVKKILAIGTVVCVLTPNEILVYNFDATQGSISLHTKLNPPQMLGNFVDAAHLPTYLNKLVVATLDSVLIYSFKTGRLLHAFEGLTTNTITMIEPCPVVLDLIAIIDNTGDIALMNLRKGKNLFSLSVGEAVSSVSFRTDGSPLLGVGTPNGDLFFYNLSAKRRVHSLRGVHKNPGCGRIVFLPGAPVMVSAGKDNTLLEIVFDPPVSKSNNSLESPPRIVRQRGGHSKPPSCLEFMDEDAHFLLSGSVDQSLWCLSLRKDSQNHQLSQKDRSGHSKINIDKKANIYSSLPAVVAVAQQPSRQNDWDSILTCHRDEKFARSWDGKRGRLGTIRLFTPDDSVAKCVFVTDCGNFGLVGSMGGGIAVYNMQSGILRKKFKAHDGEITGLAVNAQNSIIVSTSLDGKFKIFSFSDNNLLSEISQDCPLSHLRLHTGSSLATFSSDDMEILVVDVTTRKVIRKFWGHGNRITSLDFTPDGRSVLSSSLDSTIRIWDIPSGGCTDAIRIPVPATVLRVAPTGDCLATAHVSGSGIQIWNLAAASETTRLRLIDVDDEIESANLPNASGEGSENIVAMIDRIALGPISEAGLMSSDFGQENDTSSLGGLLTFFNSGLHKFNSLIHLETIKERSKPKEIVSKPGPSSFFLGSDHLSKTSAESSSSYQLHDELAAPQISRGDLTGNGLSGLLSERQFSEYISLLVSMGPSATEIEIRSLDMHEPYTELILFIEAISHGLERGHNYDLLQAWIKLFYQAHGDVLVKANPQAGTQLARLLKIKTNKTDQLNELAQYCSGVLNHLRRININ